MELSRRRERELARLGEEASTLWHRQRDVLSRAGDLLRDTGRQAGDIGRDDLYPKARRQVESRLDPVLTRLGKAPQKESAGFGASVLMAIGAAAVAIIGYASSKAVRGYQFPRLLR